MLTGFTDLIWKRAQCLRKSRVQRARSTFVCGSRMFLSKASKQDHRRVQKTARSEMGLPAQQNEHLPFLISEIEANDEPWVCWQREWNWIVYKRPVRPDICFGICCGWSMALVCGRYVCVWKLRHSCLRVGEAENRPLQLLLQYIYTFMFVEVGEAECVSAGKTALVFLPLQSLLSLTDNGITHQRSFSLYPILLRPLTAFVHIHHDNSLDPNLHQQASPYFLSPSGERLNLDENEIFICAQQVMAILIWYNFWCNISHCCFISALF